MKADMATMSGRRQWWRGARGEWYVAAQFALLALVAFGPRTMPGVGRWFG